MVLVTFLSLLGVSVFFAPKVLADAATIQTCPGFEYEPDTSGSASPPCWLKSCVIEPKVVIISLFAPEAATWYGIPEFNVLALNVTVPGLSPLFPEVHCTYDGDICQLTLGESEINAAVSLTSLWTSPRFDLQKTYMLTAGIAGVNPELATLGSVTFARYAVQVALQYEFDYRDVAASNLTTGYIPQGSKFPTEYPKELYGTEVFELNDALRQKVAGYAQLAVLNDSATAVAYRANYAQGYGGVFAAGAAPPSVVLCDVATSDTYFSGTLLSEAFGNYTKLVTNGTGTYCTTAQEDNAIHESLLRAALANRADFSRIITLRTCSDFDRPYPGQSSYDNLFADPGGFLPSIRNIYLAGVKVIQGILVEWDSEFEGGIEPSNYIGDVFGSLGGMPDFGPGRSKELPASMKVKRKREIVAGRQSRRRG